MLSAIAAQVVRPVYLLKLEFVGSTLYLSSLNNDISWSAQTWLGNGSLIDLDGIQEISNARASGWRAMLNGSDNTIVSLALGNTNQSKKGYLYLGLLDSSEALIADPEQIAEGEFDSADIASSGSETSVVLNFENQILTGKKITELRYTHFSQRSIFPSDDGFQYVNLLEDWSGFWGKSGKTPRHARKRKTGGRN